MSKASTIRIARKMRKASLIATSSLQAKLRKAQDIAITPKGKNGRSMSAALLAQHGISLPTKEGK